jgi:hypothetical protein
MIRNQFPRHPRAWRQYLQAGLIAATFCAGFYLGVLASRGRLEIAELACCLAFFFVMAANLWALLVARRSDDRYMREQMKRAANQHIAREGGVSREPWQ